MRRGSGMKAVEKRGLSLRLKVFEEYLGNLHHHLRTPIINENQLPSYGK